MEQSKIIDKLETYQATLGILHFVETRRHGGCPKEPKERWCKKEQTCTCWFHPKPFQRGPPLNSTTFLRLKSTEKKRRETPSSIVFEGHQIVLCLVMICLKYSMHTISPQKHCHQSPKQLRDKYALTPAYIISIWTMSFRRLGPSLGDGLDLISEETFLGITFPYATLWNWHPRG